MAILQIHCPDRTLAEALALPPLGENHDSYQLHLRYFPSQNIADRLVERPIIDQQGTLFLPELYDFDSGFYSPRLAWLTNLPEKLRPLCLGLYRLWWPCLPLAKAKARLYELQQEAGSGFKTEDGQFWLADGQEDSVLYQPLRFIIDWLFALAVVVLLFWLLLICWVMVKSNSSGPGIFSQVRITRNQHRFTCYKFRTMAKNTADMPTHHAHHSSITKVGHFLRASKLDELPQILNLMGRSMTLVGPRPCLPSQSELISARSLRHVYRMISGISGLAQVRGIDMRDPILLARTDAEYMARRSLWLDVKIILKTVGIG